MRSLFAGFDKVALWLDSLWTQLSVSGQEADKVLEDAAANDVAFLVVGDPFGYVYQSMCALPAIKLPCCR